MSRLHPLEEYTEEQYLDKSIADKKRELAELKAQAEEYKRVLNSLHDILDGAPEALIYKLKLNMETMMFENPSGDVTWVIDK